MEDLKLITKMLDTINSNIEEVKEVSIQSLTTIIQRLDSLPNTSNDSRSGISSESISELKSEMNDVKNALSEKLKVKLVISPEQITEFNDAISKSSQVLTEKVDKINSLNQQTLFGLQPKQFIFSLLFAFVLVVSGLLYSNHIQAVEHQNRIETLYQQFLQQQSKK